MPAAESDVEFTEPRLRWSGHAYLDANAGDAPLEDDFAGWHWSRAWDTDLTRVFYDVSWRGGGGRELAVAFLAIVCVQGLLGGLRVTGNLTVAQSGTELAPSTLLRGQGLGIDEEVPRIREAGLAAGCEIHTPQARLGIGAPT